MDRLKDFRNQNKEGLKKGRQERIEIQKEWKTKEGERRKKKGRMRDKRKKKEK